MMAYNLLADFDGNSIPISKFLSTDIAGKLLFAFSYTDLDRTEHLRLMKVTQRAQVSAGTGVG